MRRHGRGWYRSLLWVCFGLLVVAGTNACTTYYGTRVPEVVPKDEDELTELGPSNEEAIQDQMEYDVWRDTNL